MTTANTTPQHTEAEEELKAGTRWQVKLIAGLVLAGLLFVVAQTGLFVRQDIWAPSLWWLLPVGALVVIVMSFVRDFLRTGRESLGGFDWNHFPSHPVRTVKRYRRRNQASDTTWQAFRKVFLRKVRNRIICLIVPLVLFVSFLVLIFSRIAESIWAFVAGNQHYGQNGFGLWGVALVLLSYALAVYVYWRLLHNLRRIANGVRFPVYRLIKIIAFTALVPLAFVLPLGCSIVINSGS